MSTPFRLQMPEIAILAGGCFWCLEAVFQQVVGVITVESGYIGGHVPNPSYEQVCDGDTGHAEAVRLHFDPAQIPYEQLLAVFFAIHDPTTLNRQGGDIGEQYRSAIFCLTPAQRAMAERVIAQLNASGEFEDPIVTQVVDASTFYRAEPEHDNYYQRHRKTTYCRLVIRPKIEKFREHFRAWQKSDASFTSSTH